LGFDDSKRVQKKTGKANAIGGSFVAPKNNNKKLSEQFLILAILGCHFYLNYPLYPKNFVVEDCTTLEKCDENILKKNPSIRNIEKNRNYEIRH